MCGAEGSAEASQAPPPSPMKEDTVSDLSTELGSEDSDENSGDAESPGDSAAWPDVIMGTSFSAEETLLIFDWDDTILPSTWVQQQGLRLDEGSVPTDEQFAMLQRMADSARGTLQGALQRGRVIIVTNGEQGWVELSCWKFMPSLAPILEGVPIVSARSTYEKQGIVSPFEWKLHAFSKEIHGFYADSGSDVRRNILSLGDSMHEHMALAQVTQGMTNCRAKALKFVSFPELEQLIEQHELVGRRMDDIVDHDGDLSLEVLAA
mmetsp:Transcript_101169/g.321282  ORF Transcript_101169/g.321282 Transcript_101169/m.321282 type:complete len:264 (-) Transcript_101169:101-892(-)